MKAVTQEISEKFHVKTEAMTEPVKDWTETPSGNLLQLFGEDKCKYGFKTQLLIMATLVKSRQGPSNSSIRFFERSSRSARHIFFRRISA